jgi:hypothetical protein
MWLCSLEPGRARDILARNGHTPPNFGRFLAFKADFLGYLIRCLSIPTSTSICRSTSEDLLRLRHLAVTC